MDSSDKRREKHSSQAFMTFAFAISLPVMVLIGGRTGRSPFDTSWQNLSLLVSMFCLMILGSRRRARKRRFGLKTMLLLMAYTAVLARFATSNFSNSRQGAAVYCVLAIVTYFGADFWVRWVARRGEWGQKKPGEGGRKKKISAQTPFDAPESQGSADGLALRFTLPDGKSIRGESWQGAVVAEFSRESSTVYWPTEKKWRRTAPDWAMPCWSDVLDQLKIWCEAEDASIQLDDAARITFE